MTLALLLGVQPKAGVVGPVVRLKTGMWNLRGNLVDSKVSPEFPVRGPAEISVRILEAGTEKSLSLFAELIHEHDSPESTG